MEARENMSAGVTVIGAEAPSNYHVAARTENMAGNPTVVEPPMAAGVAETMGKKKRGRPRKYGPDGALSRALSPIPISSSAPPASTGNFSANKRGRGRPIGSENKQKEKMDLDNSGDLVDCSAGTNFMTHMITVNKGEDITMKIISFTKQGPRAICIISAIGLISNATLRHPDSSGATLTYERISLNYVAPRCHPPPPTPLLISALLSHHRNAHPSQHRYHNLLIVRRSSRPTPMTSLVVK
ncbi:hypothetical protein TEA_012146 [Camellia sinensis var. sinensis]|uniref:AT-hook motif nuclear-localized protein n=1 Tax=Camellia sinensis var. sinensis TaxID=542762 RepID=A0A4S4DQD3_CAMSN|nr:hypothetical protein TEA_012146 [Camellia sinensis var. sinensis]